MQCACGPFHLQARVARQDSQGAIDHRRRVIKAAQKLITHRDLLQGVGVARIELERTQQVARQFVPPTLPPVDKTGELKNQRLVRQSAAGELQFLSRSIVLKKTAVKVLG